MKYVIELIIVSVFAYVIAMFAYLVHPALAIATFPLAYYLYFLYTSTHNKRWNRLPTLEEYLTMHSECKSKKGVSCYQCNGNRIRNWGLDGPSDIRRIHICNQCSTDLYRSRRTA